MTKIISSEQVNTQQDAPVLPLKALLGGKKYAWISHAGETYLLQLTKANKLLLTK
ncbi:MAG: hemin uptake protein HemP [Pseudomonadota bacterium]